MTRSRKGQAAPIRPRRSLLYVPGTNDRALEKARNLNIDGIIFDLEDAVAPGAKETARAQVLEALTQTDYGPRERIVRINSLATPWGEEDLRMATAARPDAVLVPKINNPAAVKAVADRLDVMQTAESTIAIWAMMETPRAMLNAANIAQAAQTTPLAAFVMGTNDLAKDTRARIQPGRLPMIAWLSTCVAAARAFGLDIIDGVFNDFGDSEGFARECRQGRDLGMTGKTIIHPKQIEACNAAFSPPVEDVEFARRIIAAFDLPENQGQGVITVEGRMVELLHAEMARETVAIANAIAARKDA